MSENVEEALLEVLEQMIDTVAPPLHIPPPLPKAPVIVGLTKGCAMKRYQKMACNKKARPLYKKRRI